MSVNLTPTLQDKVREWLVRVTLWIPGEAFSGAVFGIALIITDHFFNLRG